MKSYCVEIQNSIQAYMDGDISRKVRIRIEKHLNECPECRFQMESENFVLQSLKQIPEIPCPDQVVHRIRGTCVESGKDASKSRMRMLWTPSTMRPILWGFVFTALLLVVISRSLFWKGESAQINYSEEQLLMAKTQAEWTLAYVSRKLNNTERDIFEDVVLKDVPVLIRKTLKNSIPFLKGEQQ